MNAPKATLNAKLKTVGKEVAFLRTKAGNPRNGEGTFARLKDGRILHVYTEYYGDSWIDEATAHLAAVVSSDEGETWSEPFVLLEKDETARNYMSPSLLRLPSGDLGLCFLRKEISDEGETAASDERILCMPVFSVSKDEGETWSDPVYCIDRKGYYCGINDGILLQKCGRILMPVSIYPAGVLLILASEDCGQSWYTLGDAIRSPFPAYKTGLEEPGIYEHENGDLWLYARTIYGHQYETHSTDGGKSWSPVVPNLYFTSPNAPMRVKRVRDLTVAVFNPSGASPMRGDYSARGSIRRTPLVCAVSDDDGRSFGNSADFTDGKPMLRFRKRAYLLESSPDDTYCYPSILETKDGFLVAYYHSGGGTYTLASTKITKVRFDELD